jgi:hypothetical protein
VTSLAAGYEMLYVGTTDTQVRAYPIAALLENWEAIEPLAIFSGHSDTVQCIACSKAHHLGGAGEEVVYTGGGDGNIFALRSDTLSMIGKLEVSLKGAALASDSKWHLLMLLTPPFLRGIPRALPVSCWTMGPGTSSAPRWTARSACGTPSGCGASG